MDFFFGLSKADKDLLSPFLDGLKFVVTFMPFGLSSEAFVGLFAWAIRRSQLVLLYSLVVLLKILKILI